MSNKAESPVIKIRTIKEGDDSTPERKSPLCIECRRRNICCVGEGSDVELIDSLVKMGKWSDGEHSEEDRDGAGEESAE